MTLLPKTTMSIKAVLAALGVMLYVANAGATPVFYTVNLRGAAPPAIPSELTNFLSYVVSPVDSNSDAWYETVLKINLNNPAYTDPYTIADFRVFYDGAPTGLSVNIGDSSTNNGGSGDGGTQSNDAEMQIGSLLSSEYSNLSVFGNDNTPPANKLQGSASGLADMNRNVVLTLKDQYLSWDNLVGTKGSVGPSAPPFDYLFALNGQPDSEGLVNYDIYAAFNRVIAGGRMGSGVGEVEVCLRTANDGSCFFSAVPEPGSLSLTLLGLGAVGLGRRRNFTMQRCVRSE